MRTRALVEVPSLLVAVLIGSVAATACDKKSDSGGQPSPSPASAAVPAGGQVRVTIGDHGFSPGSVSVDKGAAGSTASVAFVRTTDQTCAKEVVFPDLGIKKDLPLNQVVTVDVPADAARTLTFQCGMAMYKGSLVVK